MDKHSVLSIEKLAAFMEGNLTNDEMERISQMADSNFELYQLLDANDVIDNSIASFNEQDLQLPDEITGTDFRIPDIENEEFFSSIDSFLGDEILSDKEDINADDSIKDSGQINDNDNMDMYRRTIGESEPFPGADTDNIQQQFADTCAIKSQQIVLQSFGQDVPEEQLRQEAIDLGIYTPGHGTMPDNAGDLLNNHNVPTHVVHDAHVYDLVNELAQGHKVIVGVDSGELWSPSILEKIEDWFGGHADHALVVTGIDTTDVDNVKVIITDPGSGDVAIEYPMTQFIDAWHDSNCIMIATDDAAPVEFEPLMANFDYEAGHIESIGDLPYETYVSDIMPIVDMFLNNDNALGNDGANIFDKVFGAFNSFDVGDRGMGFKELLYGSNSLLNHDPDLDFPDLDIDINN